MSEVFKINKNLPYYLKTQNDFSSRVFLAPKVWTLVPEKMKECSYLEAFKS